MYFWVQNGRFQERVAFEFNFEEWIGHWCMCPGLAYISISSLGVWKIGFSFSIIYKMNRKVVGNCFHRLWSCGRG